MNLVALMMNDVDTARAARNEIANMSRDNLVKLEDAVVVYKDAKGDVKLDQAVNLTTAGAVGGAWWGVFLGALLGLFTGTPYAALAGAAGGGFGAAVRGRLSADPYDYYRFTEETMKAAIDHMRSWALGTPDSDWVSMAVP